MTEKDSKQQNADNEKKEAKKGEDPGNQEAAIPNPFEDGISQLTPEQEENIEQFKEAQTERD